ncbi:hypothetical protein ACWGB8_33975 [Kitasatospora sp. NPDC054939]
MTTARALHAETLRDHLAPGLRALGFTGWRRSFSLPDATHWALLGVVELPAADRVRYTFDLSLVRRSDWTAAGRPGLRPDPRTVHGMEAWRARIGELLPVGEDLWWEVMPGPRWQVAVQDSLAAVRHYGLPELRRRIRQDRSGDETYLSPADLEEVNAALLTTSVARIQRAELVDGALVLSGAWRRGDAAARDVLAGVADGFLSAGDERFTTVRCLDTLGRGLWVFPR